jgi:CxxC motif-containing protein
MKLTCIECPIGCEIEVEKRGEELVVTGNSCPRGKLYAENEITCPRRVLTTTVRAENGKMLAVKTDAPVKKEEMFDLIKKINKIRVVAPITVGQIIVENLTENVNLIATSNL